MKLFQIEEPDGAPLAADGPGAAVGIDLGATAEGGAVAIAVGGNAEILPGHDGEPRLPAPGLQHPDGQFDKRALAVLLLALRERAEKQLARPVTHAVIAGDRLDEAARAAIAAAASAAGIEVLRLLESSAAVALAGVRPEAAALGAAIAAEDAAANLPAV